MESSKLRATLKGIGGIVACGAALAASSAFAQDIPGRAVAGEVGLQPAVTPIAHEIHFFYNDILTPIIVGIVLFVAGLLVYCMIRFNEKANPVPSRTTHNTLLEVAWTIIPVLILVVIAIPSFRLLTDQLTIPKPDVTLEAIGHQWYWSYAYPKDQGGGFQFDSFIKSPKDLKPGDINLLSVDNDAVVPVNKVIRVKVTSTDVIHGFVVQAFGVRIDAIPGRMNETWFKAEKTGTYYGQCSLLCGQNHAYMPIVFKVVTEPEYQAWLKQAKQQFASLPMTFAQNDVGVAR